MARILAVTMQKGGVGKTTTAINLATGLAFEGERVLLVDMDPQGNATSGLGVKLREDEPALSELLLGEADLASLIHPTGVQGLDLLPSTLALNGTQATLIKRESEYDELKSSLRGQLGEYDWVVMDCPPSLGPLTLNALNAAHSVLIPIQCEYYALEGLSQLWETFQRVQKQMNPSLRLCGILLTMYDGRTNLAEEVRAEVQEHFGEEVFETVVPRNVRVSEAPGHGQPVMTYAPNSAGTNAYQSVTREVLAREQKQAR